MPASPFDFEDPERFAPVELEFPVEPDIVYMLGVRFERSEGAWLCPHGSLYATVTRGALNCLERHEEESTP